MNMKSNPLKYLLLLIIIFSFPSHANNQELINKFNAIKSDNYGIQATNPALNELMLLYRGPSVSATGKSLLTVNKMGFDVLDNSKLKDNWLLEEFYRLTSKKIGVILDVGCGYGNLALDALSNGNLVIANDIAVEHLIEVRRKAILNNFEVANLFLTNQSFPYQIELSNESLNIVLLHRILHFLSPQEIEDGLAKVHKWLRPNGKVVIVVMAPQHKSFSKWFLPIYNSKWEKGNKWPGVNLPVEKALLEQAYNLPKYLHVMDERPLRYVLEKQGFKIEKIDFIDMKQFGKAEDNRDGHEAIGVIAVKH